MKTTTCKQLGGACDKEFQANTFGEMAEMSKKHGMEIYKKGDEKHIQVMREMKELMSNPQAPLKSGSKASKKNLMHYQSTDRAYQISHVNQLASAEVLE